MTVVVNCLTNQFIYAEYYSLLNSNYVCIIFSAIYNPIQFGSLMNNNKLLSATNESISICHVISVSCLLYLDTNHVNLQREIRQALKPFPIQKYLKFHYRRNLEEKFFSGIGSSRLNAICANTSLKHTEEMEGKPERKHEDENHIKHNWKRI